MAHGDIGTGVATVHFSDQPETNPETGNSTPWRLKTDQRNGVPERLKSWDNPGVNPSAEAEFTWQEKHREYQGRTMVDFFITHVGPASGGVAASPGQTQADRSDTSFIPASPQAPPQPAPSVRRLSPRPWNNDTEVTRKSLKIDFWAATSRAIDQLGPGKTLEEYQTQTGLLLNEADRYVAQRWAEILAARKASDDVPF